MATKSIGTYHATIAATAQPFISELKRADNESRRATASIRASIGNTMRSISREFTLPKLAKGLMAGFGIGGGMQLVDMGITKLMESFRASAEHAEEMTEAIEKMRKSLRDLRQESFGNVLAGLDPVERPAAVSRELAYTQQLKESAERSKAEAEVDMQMAREGLVAGRQFNPFTSMMTEDPFGGRFAPGTSSDDILKSAAERQTKAAEEIDSLRKRIGELTRKHAEAVEQAANGIRKAQDDQFNLYVHELNLGAGRSPSQVRGEIGPGATQTVAEQWAQIIKDREHAGQEEFDRWARAGAVRVDDMTRRGLGTGADYRSIGEKTNSILSQILDTTRKALSELRTNAPRFAD